MTSHPPMSRKLDRFGMVRNGGLEVISSAILRSSIVVKLPKPSVEVAILFRDKRSNAEKKHPAICDLQSRGNMGSRTVSFFPCTPWLTQFHLESYVDEARRNIYFPS